MIYWIINFLVYILFLSLVREVKLIRHWPWPWHPGVYPWVMAKMEILWSNFIWKFGSTILTSENISFGYSQDIDHWTTFFWFCPFSTYQTVLHFINHLLRPGWTGIMRDHLRRIIPHTTWYFKRSAFSHPDTRKRAAPLFKVFTTSWWNLIFIFTYFLLLMNFFEWKVIHSGLIEFLDGQDTTNSWNFT